MVTERKKELSNDPEQLETFARLRVELTHKWYMTIVKMLNGGIIHAASKREE